MDVLLVEPWYGGSHQAWADGYRRSSGHAVRLVTHPGQFWRWRLRGGAVTLARAIREDLRQHGDVDVVLVSGMVDVAQLTGLLRRELGNTPVALYLHESQAAYPTTGAVDGDAAWRGWTSLLAADAVFINSHHHIAELTAALNALMAAAPDQPHAHLVAHAVAAIRVIPVGVDPIARHPDAGPGHTPLVLWNHRWDDDKHPDVFVRAIERLVADGVELEVVLAGEDVWDKRSRAVAARQRLGDAVVASGPFDRDVYRSWVARSDIVVSVTNHEFFGVSVVEALSAGCIPVLPAAHSYPEIVPEAYHTAALYQPGAFRQRLAEVVADLGAARQAVNGLDREMDRYGWGVVAPQLDDALEHLVLTGGS